ncbi:dihydrofolate reductase [Apophysomyces sp. BC1034]|nr:dihydrofolate reductase [Apophysomyces sp. BC1021]KAG0191082.1 dihydrofolate reductase [Apophysomyces sp. BC1034]
MTKFGLVVAATEELGIGIHGDLPWRIPKDMAFFKHVTTHIPKQAEPPTKDVKLENAVIMGRVTWESIPLKFRPLADRFNLVISRNKDYDLNVAAPSTSKLVASLDEAFASIDPQQHPRVFVIGGAQMYKLAIQRTDCTHIVLTRVKSKINCDVFFPEIDEAVYRLATHEELEAYVEKEVPQGVQTHKEIQYEFTLYIRR